MYVWQMLMILTDTILNWVIFLPRDKIVRWENINTGIPETLSISSNICIDHCSLVFRLSKNSESIHVFYTERVTVTLERLEDIACTVSSKSIYILNMRIFPLEIVHLLHQLLSINVILVYNFDILNVVVSLLSENITCIKR